MQRITITEQDLTKNNSESSILSSAVLIPGFATKGEVGVPVKCTTLSEFKSAFIADDVVPKFRDDAFSTTKTYVKGDRCYYAYSTTSSAVIPTVYECKVETTTPGEFSISDWTALSDAPGPQYYPVSATNTDGFTSDAIPPHQDEEPGTIMFAAGTVDPSYSLACRLLSAGIPIYYIRMNQYSYSGTGNYPAGYDVSVKRAYEFMASDVFVSTTTEVTSVADMCYNIKFITSGGYPAFEYKYKDGTYLADMMANIAKTRGDSVALIDHTDYRARALVGTGSVYSSLTSGSFLGTSGSFASMFTPWCIIGTDSTTNEDITVPASYAYLVAYAISAQTNPAWLAIAGVSRGQVSILSLNTEKDLTNTIAESYQKLSKAGMSINPITYIDPYGYCIWGNRTLSKVTEGSSSTGFATSFLNLRNLVSDIKKQAYLAAQSCMFEQNTDLLWANFKSLIVPLLDQMTSASGIKSYSVVKNSSTDKTKISATIKIQPIFAVEAFDINVIITDDEVEVTG